MTPAALQAWRARMGWTAKEAAAALGLSTSYYSAYELGYILAYCKATMYEPNAMLMAPGRTGEYPHPIPRHIELATERLEQLHKETAK